MKFHSQLKPFGTQCTISCQPKQTARLAQLSFKFQNSTQFAARGVVALFRNTPSQFTQTYNFHFLTPLLLLLLLLPADTSGKWVLNNWARARPNENAAAAAAALDSCVYTLAWKCSKSPPTSIPHISKRPNFFFQALRCSLALPKRNKNHTWIVTNTGNYLLNNCTDHWAAKPTSVRGQFSVSEN